MSPASRSVITGLMQRLAVRARSPAVLLQCTAQTAASIVWAWARLGERDVLLFEAVGTRVFSGGLLEKFNSHGQR
jgi:hypothetical protein